MKYFTFESDFFQTTKLSRAKKIMMKNEENKTQVDLEWKQRILCSDESCIGVIGPDGRCKECGLPYAGPFNATNEETAASDFEDADSEDEISEEPEETVASNFEDADPEDEIGEEPEEAGEHDAETPTDLDWEQRTLCSDESCIGVIGPDGLCKECGKPYKSEQEIENSEQEIEKSKEEIEKSEE